MLILLRNVQKREEIIRTNEHAQQHIEKLKKYKIDQTLDYKLKSKIEEAKVVKRKDKEIKKLSLIEEEMVKRLKDTHLKQSQALEQVNSMV